MRMTVQCLCAQSRPGVPQGDGFISRARAERVGEGEELDAVHRIAVTTKGIATTKATKEKIGKAIQKKI